MVVIQVVVDVNQRPTSNFTLWVQKGWANTSNNPTLKIDNVLK
jgi:hypothetical protein